MEREKGKGIFKRITAVLMAVIMLLCVAPLEGVAELDFSAFNLKTGAATELAATGNCGEDGDNVTWTFNSETGELVISGTGDMAYYGSRFNYSPFYERTDIKTVTIEPGVTSIGSYAFYNCTSLTSVTIGNSVTSIGSYAFYNCTSLESVTIGNSVENIGDSAFNGCTSLTSVTIGNSVTSIGYSAFYNCTSLTSVTIGNSVTIIDYYAFYNCTSLTSVTIGNSVTSIGSYAFNGCTNIEKVCISDIEVWCKISFYDYDSNPLYYGADLYLNGELLTNLVIPDSVTSIGSYAFRGCTSLTSVTIGNSVTSIGSEAFYNCTSLESATIPDSVTSIGNNNFNYQIVFCSKNSYAHTWAQENNIPFALTDGTEEENVPSGSFGKFSWKLDRRTGTLEINGSGALPDFGDTGAPWKDYKNGVLKIVYSEGFTDLGTGFSSYPLLRAIVIPSTVTKIGSGAFYDCNNIKSIYISDIAAWCNMRFADYWFTHNNSNPLINGADLYLNGEIVTDLVIPDGATLIGNYAFYSYKKLKTVTISESVTSIGPGAFKYCENLENVTIPNSVTSIEQQTFSYCTNLKSVTIGNGVTYIDEKAFYNCTSLEELTIPYKVKSIGSNVFPTSLKNVKIYSRDCSFASDCGLTYNQTIYGFKGSTAETFADQIGANFIDIETVHTHTEEIIQGKPATCTKTGLTESKKCTVCGTVTVAQKEIPANGHSHKATVTTPTCTAEGYTTYTCSCGDTYVDERVSALGHKDDNGDYKCDYGCAYEFPKPEPTTVPTTAKPVETTAPTTQPTTVPSTETTTVSTTVPTTVPSTEETTTVHTHTEVVIPAVNPTYSKTGLTEGKKCSECGEILVAQKKVARKKLKKVSGVKTKSVKLASGTKTTLTLSWSKVTGAEKYVVEQYINKKWKTVATTKKTSYTVKKLKADNTYKFRVRAAAGNYFGSYSKAFTAKTVPLTPTLTVKAGKKQLTASWKTVANITGYEVQYSTSKKFTKKTTKTSKITKAKTIKKTIKSLKKGKKYFVKVRAYKTVGEKKIYGAWSTVKSVKVK